MKLLTGILQLTDDRSKNKTIFLLPNNIQHCLVYVYQFKYNKSVVSKLCRFSLF